MVAAARVEAARSVGGRWTGFLDISRRWTRRYVAGLLREGRRAWVISYLVLRGRLHCTVLLLPLLYTPFMSRSIVTEALGTYSDGQGRE